jgi:Ca-activated chloride channel family protein
MAAEQDYDEAPPANLLFLVDDSGSMNPPERMPLGKASLKLLADSLRSKDKVSLVTYADGSQVVLKPTSGSEKSAILAAIDNLTSGGGTAAREYTWLTNKPRKRLSTAESTESFSAPTGILI